MKTGSIAFSVCIAILGSVGLSMAAEAGFPTRAIEMMVAYGPGGGTDLGARGVAEEAKKYLGQDVVVTNKPGGGGRVALTLVSKVKPDGYSVGAIIADALVFGPFMEKAPFKPLEDFTFISQYGTLAISLGALSGAPFRTFKDLIEYARANPDVVTIGTVRTGSLVHKALEIIALSEGVKIKLVPFSGAATAIPAMLGGHVMVATATPGLFLPHIKQGKVKQLVIMSDEKKEAFPEVPTLKELGFPLVSRFMTVSSSYLFVGPKNMEKPVVKKLEESFKKAVESPAYIKLAKDVDIWTKSSLSGDELREEMRRAYTENEELLKKLGVEIAR